MSRFLLGIVIGWMVFGLLAPGLSFGQAAIQGEVVQAEEDFPLPLPREAVPERESPFAPAYLALVAVGLVLLCGGFYASEMQPPPFRYLGAVAAPLGFVVALFGVVMFCIPGFLE